MGTKNIKKKLFDGANKKQCFYCKNNLTFENATIDHKIPRAMGGQTTIDNSVVACRKCNGKKGNMKFEDFLKTLKWRQRQKRATDFKNRR